jgi:hypothetical protein
MEGHVNASMANHQIAQETGALKWVQRRDV